VCCFTVLHTPRLDFLHAVQQCCLHAVLTVQHNPPQSQPCGSQGEANADQKIAGNDQTQYYAAMYQGMIADWRDKKGMGDFAFMTVQLPPSVPSVDSPQVSHPHHVTCT